MSAANQRIFVGHCRFCDRDVRRQMHVAEVGEGCHRIHCRCRECGHVAHCRSAVQDGEVDHSNSSHNPSPLTATPEEIVCAFRGGETA